MSRFSPSMLTSPDSSMIEDLTIDELRWLEASEILDFPTSPMDSYHLNDRVVLSQRISRYTDEAHLKNTPRITPPTLASSSPTRDARPSKRSTSASHSLPTPPRTPRRSSPPQLNVQGSPPSEWLYRRPKTPSTSRDAPSTSALSSTLTLAPSRTQAEVHDKFEKPVNGTKASGHAPFWSTMLRPRSRSVRSIPSLKTIPSQSQVDLHDPISDDNSDSITISRRPPSISSTSSSTLSSAASSSHPQTPVSATPDPFGAFVNRNKAYHRRHVSQPNSHLPPLSSSCPSTKSILTRTSSISTKDSAATANKSVKFVEIPTVHYASAGYWDMETVERRVNVHYSNLDTMGMNVDEMDMAHWGNTTYRDLDLEDPKTIPRGLRRLMTLSRRSSVATPATPIAIPSPLSPSPSHRRKSSASTISTATITPKNSKALPPTPTSSKALPPAPPPKSTISGPYVLGSYPVPASPTHSTISLRSTHRHKSKAKSTSSAIVPSSPAASSMYDTLEACRSSKNSAARSVRSLGSVRSESSTTPRFKSWLTRVGVGSGWSNS